MSGSHSHAGISGLQQETISFSSNSTPAKVGTTKCRSSFISYRWNSNIYVHFIPSSHLPFFILKNNISCYKLVILITMSLGSHCHVWLGYSDTLVNIALLWFGLSTESFQKPCGGTFWLWNIFVLWPKKLVILMMKCTFSSPPGDARDFS
jgi:hypothetical protein